MTGIANHVKTSLDARRHVREALRTAEVRPKRELVAHDDSAIDGLAATVAVVAGRTLPDVADAKDVDATVDGWVFGRTAPLACKGLTVPRVYSGPMRLRPTVFKK